VHDYVTAVHPWLVSLRGDILASMGDLWDNIPLRGETELMVNTDALESVDPIVKDRWIADTKGVPIRTRCVYVHAT
jgi:hypothetical protein